MKTSLLPQTRLFMIQCLLTMVLAFSFNNAQAQSYGTSETQSHVRQYMSQGQEIELMQKLKLKNAIKQGMKVLALKVEAQANQYNTKLILKLNGQKIETKSIRANSYETVFAVPTLHKNDSLSLKVKGSAYIQKVTATLKSAHSGGGQGGVNQSGVLKAVIRHSSRGTKIHQVKQLIKSQNQVRLQGMKVQKVIVKASSMRGNAKATLLINGSQVGFSQKIPMAMTHMVFDLNSWSQNIIGHDINSIKIKVSGNVTTQMVGIKVNQSGQGGSSDNVSVNINQAIYGSQRLSLASLLPYGSHVNQNKAIESITVVARGKGTIHIAGAGRGQGAIQVQGQTTQSVRVQGHTTLKTLMLRIRATGQKVVIEQVRIKFKRGH
jgi:hypothetical protein